MCIGRVNGGAKNAPPFVDLPPQSRRVAVREEKSASAADCSVTPSVFLSLHLDVHLKYHLNTLLHAFAVVSCSSCLSARVFGTRPTLTLHSRSKIKPYIIPGGC